MGTIKDNSSKWFDFATGRLYSDPPIGGGQNLNDDLQQNIANEIDVVSLLLHGSVVVGDSSWVITPTSNALEVQAAAGSGFFSGQCGVTSGTVILTSLSGGITYDIYAQLDDADPSFNNSLGGWKVAFTSLTTGSAPPSNSVLLAKVIAPSSGVVPPGNITDRRVVHERQSDIANTINDQTIVPATNARKVRDRFGMLAYRIREIMGTPSWTSPLPTSLSGLLSVFDTVNGHKHNGQIYQGPKLAATNITTVAQNGITQATSQLAIEELHAKKLSLNGSQPMTGPLVLVGDPVSDLQAATKRYVDLRSNVKQKVSATFKPSTLNTGPPIATAAGAVTPLTMLNTTLSLQAHGGLIRFESTMMVSHHWRMNTGSGVEYGEFNENLTFYLYRDGSLLFSTSVPRKSGTMGNPNWNGSIGSLQTGVPRIQLFGEMLIPIPSFTDGSPGGDPTAGLNRIYDLRWAVTERHNTGLLGDSFEVPTGNITGYWDAIET